MADAWKEPGLDGRGKANEERVMWEARTGVSAPQRHTEQRADWEP